MPTYLIKSFGMVKNLFQLKNHYLNWEKENRLFNFRINNLSAYRFIRLDLFELLIFKDEKISNIQAIDSSFNQMRSARSGLKMLYYSLRFLFSISSTPAGAGVTNSL